MPQVKRRSHTRVVNGKTQHVRQHTVAKQGGVSTSWGELGHSKAAAGTATMSALIWGYTAIMSLTAAVLMTISTILGVFLGHQQYKKRKRKKRSKVKLRFKNWVKRKRRKLRMHLRSRYFPVHHTKMAARQR